MAGSFMPAPHVATSRPPTPVVMMRPAAEVAALRQRIADLEAKVEQLTADVLEADKEASDAKAEVEHVLKYSPYQWARPIIDEALQPFGVSYKQILDPCRKAHISAARLTAILAIKRARPDITIPSLGRIFDRDHTTIRHALGLVRRPTPLTARGAFTRHGERNHSSKLSDQEARRVAELARAPLRTRSFADIAREFGVSGDTVARIARGIRKDTLGQPI